MVSLRELITQRKTELSTVESQLQQQQESISEGERRLGQQERVFLEETTPLPLTLGRQASLARIVGIGEVARAARETRREKRRARRETLPKFQEARLEIGEARSEVEAASAALSPIRIEIIEAEEFVRGRELGRSGSPFAVFALQTEQEREGFRAGVEEIKGAALRLESLRITELPPKPLGPVGSTGEIKTFGQPEKFARSFREATGQTSFTLAVPIRREDGNVFVQDFNFQFEDGELVRSRPTGSALLTEEQFLAADLRRRIKEPEFTFGSTARFQVERRIPEPRLGVIPRGIEALFGPESERFIGIGTAAPFGIQPGIVPLRPAITFRQIRETIRRTPTDISAAQLIPIIGVPSLLGLPRIGEFAGLGIRGAATLIPTTPGEVFILGGLAAATIVGPPVVGTLIAGGAGTLGAFQAFDPTLPIEERIGGGIVAGLGVAGLAAGVTPFFRGLRARISPRFRPVETVPEGFRAIPEVPEIGRIGLIEPGRGPVVGVDLPRISPLRRGAFGVRGVERFEFLGEEQLLATSQRGLFVPGVEIPIERPFFVTPAEPTLGIPETRVSRLGLVEFFRFPTTAVEIGFGIPPTPQIGVTRGAVARTEARGAFRIGAGGELEAIRTTGLITDVEPLGVTIIRGQAVDIFGFRIGPGVRRPGRPPIDLISTRPTVRVSGEALISTVLTRPTRGITTLGVPTLGVSSLRLGTTTLLPVTTALPSTGLISPTISPLISPVISPAVSPAITPTDLITPTAIPSIALFPEEPITPARRRRRRARGGVAAFDTFVKSKGRFTKVNVKPQRLENALSLGADLVDNSTSRQFKVRRSGRIRKPKRINPFFEANRFKFREFRQRGKERALTPLNFIERTAFAIDTPNEVQGIPLKGVLEQRRRRAAGIKSKRRKRRTARRRLPGSGLTDL